MAYASASDVAGWTQNILGPEDTFTFSTSPTLNQVDAWLSSGCAVIESYLNSAHYSVPVASTTTVYGWLRDLNTLFAAARVEMSRSNVTLSPGERTRGQVFEEMFWKQLKLLMTLDLTSLGVSRSSTAPIYVGGISQSDKDTRDSDSDRVPPRFRRGQWAFPGTVQPDFLESAS